jgi:hypothetical protein
MAKSDNAADNREHAPCGGSLFYALSLPFPAALQRAITVAIQPLWHSLAPLIFSKAPRRHGSTIDRHS